MLNIWFQRKEKKMLSEKSCAECSLRGGPDFFLRYDMRQDPDILRIRLQPPWGFSRSSSVLADVPRWTLEF